MATLLAPVRTRWSLNATFGDLALAVVLAALVLLDVLFSSDWRGPVMVNAIVSRLSR